MPHTCRSVQRIRCSRFPVASRAALPTVRPNRGRRVIMEAVGQPPDPKKDPDRPQCHVMARRGWINDPNGPIFFAEDPKLVAWSKSDAPFLALPPPGLPLTGWRDPFVIQCGNGRGKEWIILMGAGLKNEGGTTLIYKAKELGAAWEYAGLLCLGDPSLGAMWECPLLWEIAPAPQVPAARSGSAAGTRAAGFLNVGGTDGASLPPEEAAQGEVCAEAAQVQHEVEAGLHIFAHPEPAAVQVNVARTSTLPDADVDDPYSHFYCISPDAPTNAVIYWMGSYDPDTIKFRLQDAVGPYRLDMGDTIYAPNIFEDAKGRCVLWGWVQEHRSVGKYDFAGCMATPRVLLRQGGRLIQQPLPELAELRKGKSVSWPATTLPAGVRVPLDGVAGGALDLEVVLERSTALISGIMIEAWASNQGSAAVLYDWESSQLEVVFEGLDPATKTFSLTAPTARRVGGRLEPRGLDTLALRCVLDHSLLEVFCGTGQVITTRVYRGAPPKDEVGIDFLSLGGATEVRQMKAWEVGCIWDAPQVAPRPKTGSLSKMTGKFEGLTVDQPLSKPQSPQSNPLPAFQHGPGEPGYIAGQLDASLDLAAPAAGSAAEQRPPPAVPHPERRLSDQNPIVV